MRSVGGSPTSAPFLGITTSGRSTGFFFYSCGSGRNGKEIVLQQYSSKFLLESNVPAIAQDPGLESSVYLVKGQIFDPNTSQYIL